MNLWVSQALWLIERLRLYTDTIPYNTRSEFFLWVSWEFQCEVFNQAIIIKGDIDRIQCFKFDNA